MSESYPSSWSIAPLDKVCEKVTDGTHHSPPNHDTGAYRYVTAKNLRPWGLDLSDITYVTEEVHKKIYSRCPVEHEDVLYIKDGVTTGLAVVNPLEEEFSLLSSVALLKPHREALNPYFLKHWLNSPEAFKTLTGQMTGSAIRRIVLKQLRKAEAPVPPLNEQRRIVAKIEELTARSRNAKQALDAIPPLLERFRQSVLAAAFRGDLTKQWRQQNLNTEPASELLKRIRQERRHRWEQDYLQTQKAKGKQPTNDKWKAKYKEPEPVDVTGLPELPEGWCWSSVDELADLQLGKMLDRKKRTKGTSMPYLRNQNVRWFDFDCTDMLEMPFEDHEVERYSIKLDDVVICEGGEPGRAAVWRGPETVMYQKALHRLRPYGDGPPEWFVFHLNHEAWTGRLQRSFTGTTIKHLTRTALLKRPVPVAPLAEQLVIAGLLGQAFSSACSILDCWSTAVARASQLDQSILAKAFRGDLVPQDPNDQPAAALLEYIHTNGKNSEVISRK